MCVLACLPTWVPGENPGVQGGGRRNPLVDHSDQHPDRTAYLSIGHLRTLEGKDKCVYTYICPFQYHECIYSEPRQCHGLPIELHR